MFGKFLLWGRAGGRLEARTWETIMGLSSSLPHPRTTLPCTPHFQLSLLPLANCRGSAVLQCPFPFQQLHRRKGRAGSRLPAGQVPASSQAVPPGTCGCGPSTTLTALLLAPPGLTTEQGNVPLDIVISPSRALGAHLVQLQLERQ